MDTANVGYSYHLPSGGWNYKIRNTLSQFSDLFSEFNKYIAPAYHHDRCERSVQMRIYSMHKGEFVMVFIAFFACFGLGVFIGLAGPSPTVTTSVSSGVNASALSHGPYRLRSPALGPRAQQLWLLAEILTDNNDEEIFDKSFQISISIEGVLSDHTTTHVMPETEATNRTQHLKCKKQVCEEIMVLHLGSLEYTHYVLNVHFYGLEEFHKRYNIREIIFYFKTYNPVFTQMETWFRFIFLLTTFTVACWFAHTLRRYSTRDWAIEQKWLAILLPLLLLYNDPLFPLRLVSPGCFAPLCDAVFQTTFLACLLLAWLALYHGLRQNERGFISFYLLKVVIVGMMWTPAMIVALWQKYIGYYDPTFDYYANPNYFVVKVTFFVAVTLYFLYLLVLVVKAYSDLRNMPFFAVRLRCLSLLVSWSLLVCCAAGGAWGPAALQDHWAGWGSARLQDHWAGWGSAGLQDHWAARGSTHRASSAPFMALYGLLNFQTYAMAYLFSPASGALHDTAITKDNPAFSMINDSDEDVIYGSDEESRRPLTSRSRRAPAEDI